MFKHTLHMKHLLFATKSDKLSIAILIKEFSLISLEINKHYIKPLEIDNNIISAWALKYEPTNKISASKAKDYLITQLLPVLVSKNITTVLIADATYFKYMTGVTKIDPYHGYILPCKIKGYEHLQCILSINYGALFYNPNLQEKLDISLNTLKTHITSTYIEPGKNIIHSALYPSTYVDIATALVSVMNTEALTCDIETTGLRFDKNQIYSIAFATDKNHGIAFKVDNYINEMLKNFFSNYKGKLIFHNALFDVKILIYHLFMKDNTDYIGMRKGLEVFANIDDTMLFSYLAQNSTADIKLSLKANSQEFTGNYALDDEAINDITKIPLDKLLEYNLTDCLATWFVYEKHLPTVIADNQIYIYNTIFQPSIKPLVEMMLIGLPLNLNKTEIAKQNLEYIRDNALKTLLKQPNISQLNFELRILAMKESNSKLKKKIKSLDDFIHIQFNPASNKQLHILLYKIMKLPIIDYTKTKQPATGQKTLIKLVTHTDNKEYITILESLITLAQTSKILNDFISNFQKLAFIRNDNSTWLNGDQVLGGTQSGRLSARNPNLANLPSNSIYGKTVKSCFEVQNGWLFGGADFTSLEDKIGAILSNDKAKIAEFAQGMDGHSLRALAFFSQLEAPCLIKDTYIDPEIIKQYDITSIESVNRFKKEQEAIRQEAKAPSFALAYGGTWMTLHKNIGLPEPIAKAIEIGYQELYSDTMEFNKKNAQFANQNGYVECAFGLRLRTPLITQCILGSKSTPKEVESEARSANNAITQSYNMLSNRAAIEIQKRIIKSPYANDIFLANQIHDAIYFIWKDNNSVTKWLNDNLIACMEWQEYPAIKSNEVKLGANLSMGYSWDKQKNLNNKASIYEIEAIKNSIYKYKKWRI